MHNSQAARRAEWGHPTKTTLIVAPPADFRYAPTLDSHGWRDLAPFRYEAATQTLYRTHRLEDGTLVILALAWVNATIEAQVTSAAPLDTSQQAALRQSIRRMLALDWDLSAFYARLRAEPHYAWVEAEGHGRLLLCPSVWEELVKTLLTTNTTWGQTKTMCARLCAAYGTPLADQPDAPPAFPLAADLAGLDAAALAAATGMGYRAGYLIALAQAVAAGGLDVEAWHARDQSADAMYATLRGLKGFGDYAAGTMLRLLGYFDRVAIDTVARAAFRRIMNDATLDDAALRAYYARFGAWQGLALWMDCIRSEAMIASMVRGLRQ